MKNYRCNHYLQIALIVFVIGILALAGCNLFHGKTITIDKGIAHFSFERPEGFSVETNTIVNNLEDKYTHIVITGPIGEASINSVIGIYIKYPSSEFPDSLALWEYDMDMFKDFEGFEIIDCSPVIVDGIQGNECGFYYTETPDINPYLPDAVPIEMICKAVHFDYNGLIWEITMLSALVDIETNQAHLDHLLGTFKFLE